MSRDPVKELEDQIRLFRTELSEVKRHQLTKSEFKAFQSSLDATAQQISGVQQSAAKGGLQGAGQLLSAVNQGQGNIDRKVDKAVRSLSEAQVAVSEGLLARRRNVGLLMAFSALTGALLGGLVCLLIFDHFLERDFKDAVQTVGLDLACRARGGFIVEQTDGTFCVFERDERATSLRFFFFRKRV